MSNSKKEIIPSLEQQDICTNLELRNNVKVDCSAGSGKTYSALNIANYFSDYKILLLTFSKRLKFSSQAKIEEYNIKNLEACSFHSFAVKYYTDKAFNDLKKASKIITPKKKFSFDIIILDESQDTSNDIYELICKILKDNGKKNPYIVILMDTRQEIFKFKGSDHRYALFKDKLYKSKRNWIDCKLSLTYRLTIPMSNFINKCVLGYDKFKCEKQSDIKPRYIITNLFGADLIDEIYYYFDKGYSITDIYVIVPSLRSDSSPARILANELSSRGINIYYNIDSESINDDDDVMANKLIFLTIHQSKGLENKVVIFIGFDESYFNFYNKESDVNKCPNELYVALTRSSECLTIIHSDQCNYLPFLKQELIDEYCDVVGRLIKPKRICSHKPRVKSVIEMTSFLTNEVIYKCLEFIDISIYCEKTTKISFNNKVNNKDLFENICNITGIAIPAYHEFKNTGKMEIYDYVKDNQLNNNKLINYEKLYERIGIKYNKIFEDDGLNNLNNKNILFLANLYDSYRNTLNYKINQIDKYNWLNEDKLEELKLRIDNYIINEAKYEIYLDYNDDDLEYSLKGCIDCINNNNLWEFKCVENLSDIHMIQTALYMFLISKQEKYICNNFYLFNILDNEIYEIKSDPNRLYQLFTYLVEIKTNEVIINDDDFIKQSLLIKNKHI